MGLLYLSLYRWLIMPISLLAFPTLALLGNKKVLAGLKMRLNQNGISPWLKLPKDQKPIWIHCASGEFEYAKPILRELKNRDPKLPTLVTYFTPTYKKSVESDPNVDMSCPLPWDFPGAMASFIDYHNPQCLMIARTDLWPETLYQCQKRSVPVLLFSATQSKKPGLLNRSLKSWLLSYTNKIHCVSTEDETLLQPLCKSSSQVEATGDTRYDQVLHRLENKNPIKDELFANLNTPVLIAGSTWAADEKVLIPTIKELKTSHPFKVIFTPHEPTTNHLNQLDRQIKQAGLTSIRYSTATQWDQEDILVIDKTGILADLYSYGDLAFVGGSFKGSVHSVMEALGSGLITLVGPYHKNNREALQFKEFPSSIKGLNFVTPASSQPEFQNFINIFLTNASLHRVVKSEIKREVQKRKGASQKVIQWFESL